ncbi:hypothetical protein [Ureibacillus thermosphaericus]|uniref:hypothetical protein n=1 Tax=Ureibacillus thermosphaericus TaxID=51173 RepID=UPI0030C8F473
MNNDFLKELLNVHPELAKEYDTPQYRYSEEIIKLMMENSLEPEEMIEILGLGEEMFYRLQSGDFTIDVTIYEEALQKLKEHIKKVNFKDEQLDTFDNLCYAELDKKKDDNETENSITYVTVE